MTAFAAGLLTAGPLLGVGPGCGPCHARQVQAHAATAMAQTLIEPRASAVFRAHPRLEWTLGRYRYEITAERYRVSDGSRALDAAMRWAVGHGEAGQTWVVEWGGRLWESRASFYARLGGLGPTMGAPPGEPTSLEEALGRQLPPRDLFECLNCHATPTPASAHTSRGTLSWAQTLQRGVQCESCHHFVQEHAAQPTVKAPSLAGRGAEEMSELCGRCHRTWADIAVNGPRGIGNVRFQPYRIARARCYDASDPRIACTACHDPHARPDRASAIVRTDRACAACHAAGCPSGARHGCATCHMPKYELPGSHFQFTDHWIRLVRNRDEYPD